ncbi:hypothetical protein KAU04_08290 [bacterium]|nr:hypothetical protein [bacterium]
MNREILLSGAYYVLRITWVDELVGGGIPLAAAGVALRATGALSASDVADAVFLHVNRPRPSPSSATPSWRGGEFGGWRKFGDLD